MIARRRLGSSSLEISPVILGCWPIAGMTSLDVNPRDSRDTLDAALDLGVNSFDTAYAYGVEGESERLIAAAVRGRREQVVIATKAGLAWDEQRARVLDGRPATIRRHCEESLRRLETDHVELLYLHAPDPAVPLRESAGAIRDLILAGKARCAGLSNCSVEQLAEFHAECPLTACQPPYNMLQRQIERDIVPWCQSQGVSVLVYWPLLKGLLAGRLRRDHDFAPGDGRAKYPMFQGREWERNMDFVDRLRELAEAWGRSVSEVVVSWTIHQPGITAAICGAKRPDQIRESATALQWQLTDNQRQQLDQLIVERGEPQSRAAV